MHLPGVSTLLVIVMTASSALATDLRDPAVKSNGDGGRTARPKPVEFPIHPELPDDPPAPESAFGGVAATSPAGVWIRGSYVSIQVNVNSDGENVIGDAANEPSIAVDPRNPPSRMAIGWRQFDSIASNFRESGVAYSRDAGQTWISPGATQSRLGVLEPGVFSSDPVLDFDAQGRFYYYALQPDRGPRNWACYLYRSEDHGMTWPYEVYALGGDKAWMTIDRTGGIGHGNIYFPWNPVAGCCPPGIFTRSTNGGQSFLTPIPIPESPRRGTLTVAPDGALFIVGQGGPLGIVVVRSVNAQDPAVTPFFDRVAPVAIGGTVVTRTGPNPVGMLGQVWIVSDHSMGPRRGHLYVLSSVDPPGVDPLDVMFVRSTDGGVTWSSPVRINDDSESNEAWQWFGTMSIAPNGRLDVIWNDTRNSGETNLSELFHAYSNDGGVTWSENTPVSPMFDSWVGWPSQNKLGDYYDMISDNAGAAVAYAATFNGEQDVYYLRIGELDCNDNGFPDADDIALGTSLDCDRNDLPDECDPDCNDNDEADVCEILDDPALDCDGNLILDECDPDLDGDGINNGCDPDIDGDGVVNSSDWCRFTPPGLLVNSHGVAIGDTDQPCVGEPYDSPSCCLVDIADYQRFLQALGSSGPGHLVGPSHTDFFDYDEDHDIDLQDIAAFQHAFGRR